VSLLDIVNIVYKVTQINGNNGEWTNGDDLDNFIQLQRMREKMEEDLGRMDARAGKRVDEVGKNRQGKIPMFNFRVNEAKVNKRNAADRIYGRSRQRAQEALVNEAPEQCFHVMEQGHLQLGYVFGRGFYPEALYEVKISPPSGIVLDNVLESGPGWVKCGPKGTRKIVEPAWVERKLAAYYSPDGVCHREENHIVLRALVAAHGSKLRSTTLSDNTLATLGASVVREISGLDQTVVHKFLLWVIDHITWNASNQYAGMMGLNGRVNGNRFAALDVDEDEHHVSLETGKAMEVPSVPCPVRPVYELDPSIIIQGDFVEVLDDKGNIHKEFEVVERVHRHWYMTRMCSLEGERKFLVYDNDDTTRNGALKRCFALEEHHEERSRNEMILAHELSCAAIWDNIPHAEAVAEVCACDKFFEGDIDTIFKKVAQTYMQFHRERFHRAYIDEWLSTVGDGLGWLFENAFLKMNECRCVPLSREEIAQIQHVKKKLRQGYVKQFGHSSTDELMMPNRVKGGVKLELAKSGKVGRLTGAYEAGCMYAAELPEYIKVGLSQEFDIVIEDNVFRIKMFSKPRNSEILSYMSEIARGLHFNETLILIYSDDSVWARGGLDPFIFNVDISACDKSVKSAGFFCNALAMSSFDCERAIGLVEQCKKDIQLKSADGKRTMKWHSQYRGVRKPIETSGTVLTTSNNFMVMLLVGISFAHGGVYTKEGILSAGKLVGVNLDVSPNFFDCVEKMQFLKKSLHYADDGELVLAQNIGSVLRSFGKFFGDMEPKMLNMTLKEFMATSWSTRFEIYCSNVIAGYVHEPSSILMDALRERFRSPTSKVESSCFVEKDTIQVKRVSDSSLAARYGVTESDLKVLADQIRSLALGTIIVSETLTAIYNIDYSL